MNKKIEDGDVKDLRHIALAIQEGKVLNDEQSTFLEGVDNKWNAWFHDLNVYKTQVFDKNEKLFGKKIFHVPSGDNSIYKDLDINPKQYDCTTLNRWLMPQVELFSENNWRMQDGTIVEKLGWKRDGRTVGGLWKCIINQRRIRLQDFGVVFEPERMEKASQVKVNRASELMAARKKNLFKK